MLTPQLGSPCPIFEDSPAEGIIFASLWQNVRVIIEPSNLHVRQIIEDVECSRDVMPI